MYKRKCLQCLKLFDESTAYKDTYSTALTYECPYCGSKCSSIYMETETLPNVTITPGKIYLG